MNLYFCKLSNNGISRDKYEMEVDLRTGPEI